MLRLLGAVPGVIVAPANHGTTKDTKDTKTQFRDLRDLPVFVMYCRWIMIANLWRM